MTTRPVGFPSPSDAGNLTTITVPQQADAPGNQTRESHGDVARGCTTALEGPAGPRDTGALFWARSPQLLSLPIGNESGFPIRYWSPIIFVVFALLVLFFTYRRTKGDGELLCWDTSTTQPPQERVLATSEHPRATQKRCKASPPLAWLSSAQFGTFWATLGQLRSQHRAKQTPNPSSSQKELPGFSVLFQPPYCNMCLPSPTGSQEPTTSISDFSGEIFQLLSCWTILYSLLLLGFTSTHCIADEAAPENDTALIAPAAQVGLLPNCSS